ncbi:Putative leucine-rich repeat domain-containing protein [Candidatus Bealeia paramacronuclearis]|uniref:Leucine-rich repeat domain-containing protein n=1 Tax=Candidatus Bealeia paramacronuclearis TaxID=1921001 RepID=A0ABZ2C8G7_9PROT|nr:putative leucine-rich repeat domain-containing protein [Candidatus Bealeia paramacronuclearis]
MNRKILLGFFISFTFLNTALFGVLRTPSEEDTMEELINSYVTPTKKIENTISDMTSLVIHLKKKTETPNPITLEELFRLERQNQWGHRILITPDRLLFQIASYKNAKSPEELAIVSAAQSAWAHRPFCINGGNAKEHLELFFEHHFLTYLVLGPGLELHPEYFNILFSRQLTGFGYYNVKKNPLMNPLSPHTFAFKTSANTLRYFSVNSSPFFKATDLKSLPFVVHTLSISNQIDITWEVLNSTLSPILKSLTILYNAQMVTQMPTMKWPSKLASLQISYPPLKGDTLASLPQSLQSLTIEDANKLTSEDMKYLPSDLISLRLKNCKRLGGHFVEGLNSKIEYLEINNCPGTVKEDLKLFTSSSHSKRKLLWIEEGTYE